MRRVKPSFFSIDMLNANKISDMAMWRQFNELYEEIYEWSGDFFPKAFGDIVKDIHESLSEDQIHLVVVSPEAHHKLISLFKM